MAQHVSTHPLDATRASELLDRAARKVLSELTEGEFASTDQGTLRKEVAEVVDAIQTALAGSIPDLEATGVVDRLRVLRSLRSAMVRDLTGDDAEIVALVRAIETVQDGLLSSTGTLSVPDVLNPFSRNLLAEVAHLLRSPLGSIVMLTDTLRSGVSGPLSDVQIRQLGIVHRAALGIATVTGDLLVLVREDERRKAKTRFEVATLLETIADTARPVCSARASELVVSCAVEGARVGPSAGLTQALLGLTLRAAHRTRDGLVELDASPDQDDVVFTVRASGSLDLDDLESAEAPPVLHLDPDTGTFALSDHGLGLAAARTILESLGARLTVSVEPEELVLSFRLPLPEAD